MLDRSFHAVLAPLAPLAIRAVLIALGIRSMLLIVSAMLAFLGGDGVDGPFGVVVLSAVVGAVDIHRRHERLLWANLGYPLPVIAGLFAAVAAGFELIWALL